MFRGAGRRKTRGDGVMQAAFPVPAFDQRLAFDVAGFGCVGQVFGGVAVHHHFAGDQAQVQSLCRFKQGIDRLRMHTAKHQRRSGAIAQQFLEENIGNFVSMCLVGELVFAREGVGVEPVEQLLAIGTNHPGLRKVDVRIDKARCDQGILVLGDVYVASQCCEQFAGRPDRFDLPVFHHQQTVFEVFIGGLDPDVGGIGNAVQNGGAVGFTGHDNSQCVAWLRREDGSNCLMDSDDALSAQAVCWPKWVL